MVKGEEILTPPLPTDNAKQTKQAVLKSLAALFVDEFLKQSAKKKEKKNYEEIIQREQASSDILSGINGGTSKRRRESF